MAGTILIRGGRVYDHEGDTDRPPAADILIEDDRIAGIAPEIPAERAGRVIDAADKLVLPGFVNAHYHSHDTMLKGMLHPVPFDMWLLNCLPPAYPPRSPAELRARTMLGAAECLKSGITTLQDMVTLHPISEENVDTVLAAYEEIGIRVVLSLQIGDRFGIELTPFWRECVPEHLHDRLGSAVEEGAGAGPFEQAVEQYRRIGQGRRRLSWALGPSTPLLCTPDLLRRIAALAESDGLPVITHVNEARTEALSAKTILAEHGGSQVGYLRDMGLLGPGTGMAHTVWLTEAEIEMVTEAGATVILNPASNMKTLSGAAPVPLYLAAGTRVALGCDNCSCSDIQNTFLAMRLVCSLAGLHDPQRNAIPPAAQVIRWATEGGADALGLAGEVGALKPGMKADMTLLDLGRPSYLPFNSAARQTVYSEAGAAVHTVLVDGRVVLEGGRLTMTDEDALRDAVEEEAIDLRRDFAAVNARFEEVYEYLQEAWLRSWQEDIGIARTIAPPRF